MPAVANLVGTGEDERIRRGFWRAMRLLVLATLPLVAGVAVTGPALLRLAYGEDYADAGTVLLVMLAPLLLQPMLRVSEGILYALERVRFIVVTGLIATVVDLALAFLLIPSMDAVGAAIANGVAILVAGVPALALAVHLHRPVSLPAGPLVRAVRGLAARCAGASWAGLLVGTLVAVVAGALAFFVAAFLLRPLSAEDAEWLSDALGDEGGARRCRRVRAQNRCRMIDLHSHLLPGLDDGPRRRGGLGRARRRGLRVRRARDGRHPAPARGLPGRASSRTSRARVRGAAGAAERGPDRRSSSFPAARSTCCGRRPPATTRCAPPATAAAGTTCWSRRPTASCRGSSRTSCSGSACAGSGSCSRTRSATRPSRATRSGSCGSSRATCWCS